MREKKKKKNCAAILDNFKQKCSYLRPLLSIIFPQGFRISKNIGHPTLESGGKKTVKRYLKSEKKWRKKLFLGGNIRQFSNQNVHIWDHFFPLLFPKDSESLKILYIRLREVGAKRPLKKTEKSEEKNFFCAAILDNFQTKMLISETTFFITFPQGFWISKNIGHLTSGSGGKKTFKRYLKSEPTDRHTDRQTDKSTYRKHRPRGPMLWKLDPTPKKDVGPPHQKTGSQKKNKK